MRVQSAVSKEIKGGSIAIGTFDGVHLGHREVLAKVKEKGEIRGITTGIVTFDPPPISFFHKEFPFLLTPTQEKLTLLKETGIDFCWIIEFSEKIANLSPLEFLDKLQRELSPQVLVVGYDFRFGKESEGDISFLKRVKDKYPWELVIVPPIKKSGILVKSTTIREKLLLGNIPLANLLLGRRYAIFGEVVKGMGRGREIGFPTINLTLKEKNKLLPIDGVYAVYFYPDSSKPLFYKGVANIGKRPTFGEKERQIEVHLIGIKEVDFPLKEVKVDFLQRIRPEKRFPNLEEMRAQIREDIEKAEKIF
jgi:riboflavin kinase/FMN adenylyltransferase